MENGFTRDADLSPAPAASALPDTLLAGEKRLLEMVAQGFTLAVILDALCRLVEEASTDCHCSVLLVDASGTRFRRGAAPSLPAGYYESKEGRPVHRDSGPCGMAASQKVQVIVPDIATELRWGVQGWRPMTLAHGMRSCWSTPILSRTRKALGTFAIYRQEPGNPTPFQRALIAELTHIASIAIERAQGDAALKRSEAFLAEAQRLSSTGSFSWLVATGAITWSDQLYRIFEFEPGSPVTLDLIEARCHPEDVALTREKLELARGSGGNFEYTHRLRMPDGSVKHLHTVAHAMRDADGQLEYIGAVQDATQRRLSEDALGKARSELAHVSRVMSLGALTASIAHEVNQPLSGIITNANTCLRMLGAEPPNIEGARETAVRTIRDGNRAADVITRLRALFSKKVATKERVDLNEAVREVLALSLGELQRHRVVLRAELGDDVPPVVGDRIQIQQVILNLVLNAVDAMSTVHDRPRHLRIGTGREQGDQVRLTVRDSGTGFEPADVDKLFEAFYTTKAGGMGMGLSVSRSIVESHEGRIWAALDEAPGATFCFCIPCDPGSATGRIGSRRPAAAATPVRRATSSP